MGKSLSQNKPARQGQIRHVKHGRPTGKLCSGPSGCLLLRSKLSPGVGTVPPGNSEQEQLSLPQRTGHVLQST